MKYWPSSRDFNKLVIKAKIHTNTYFLKFSLLYENTIWFFNFWETWPYARKTKHYFYFYFYFYFFNVLTKTEYFNTGFVSLQYKNTNQYCTKLIIYIYICGKNHKFFWNNFFEETFLFSIFFWAGSNSARMGWARPSSPARSLVQTSDPAGHCACLRELLTHALHSDRVIILPL